MDMLRLGNWFIFITIILTSCTDKFNSNEIQNISRFGELSDIDCNNNLKIQIKDSFDLWISENLLSVRPLLFNDNFEINNAILFSSDSTLLFTTLNQQISSTSKTDWIYEIAGSKIDNKWYFLRMGVSTPVHRALYKDGAYEPYTFDQLNFIAYKHRFTNTVVQIKDCKFETNDEWFEKRFFVDYKTRSALDSMFLINTQLKYNHKLDSIEKEKIIESRANVKRPPEVIKELSVSEKIFGKKKKLFDSDAWKNRHKE